MMESSEDGIDIEYCPEEIIKEMSEGGHTIHEIIYCMGLEHFEDEIIQDMIDHGYIDEEHQLIQDHEN